jgi:Ser/Thr protein kinase RdoA (MazF antagonist)
MPVTEPIAPAAHAFEPLTPDVVMDALASVGLYGDGSLQALSSYENRVYQLRLEDGPSVVAKFYRPQRWSTEQILEEHAFSAELMAAEIPVIGPMKLNGNTLHHFGGFAFSVSPRRGGRAPELDNPEVLEWIGRFLARIHSVGAKKPFESRPALNLQSFAVDSRDWLLAHHMVPLDVQSAWQKEVEIAIKLIAARACLAGVLAIKPSKNGIENGLQGDFDGQRDDHVHHHHHDHQNQIHQDDPRDAGDADNAGDEDDGNDEGDAIKLIRLHGDCHPGNILWTPIESPAAAGPGPHFVDLDDARTGPAVQDLWMLISGDRQQRTRQLGALVDGYEQFRNFDRRELALIEPLRTLRLIHYSAWLARRWADPTFPINFPWFGSSDYWKGQIQMLQDQNEAMGEEPLVV